MQAYFGWAKPCSCSYCCSRHLLFYDSGRLGRVEIVTLRVGVRAKEGEGKGRTHFPLSQGGFNMAFSRAKTFARPKKTPVLQATLNKVEKKLNAPNNARRNAL